jgi:zinc protease
MCGGSESYTGNRWLLASDRSPGQDRLRDKPYGRPRLVRGRVAIALGLVTLLFLGGDPRHGSGCMMGQHAGPLFGAVHPASLVAVEPPFEPIVACTLPNGLHVVMAENHDAPVINVQVWYHVGSKDETAGHTGFAHLFEHLMFEGTKNLAPDEFSNFIVRNGGIDNAYTTADATVFWETVPSVALNQTLWLEADRMRNLRITERVFKNERQVVEEERRQRFDNQPYGNVIEVLFEHAFTVHPYRHMTIGSMADLERASVEEVRAFYDTYYVPNNATLVMVGDFDAAQARSMVAQHFAALAAGPPVARVIPREPAQTAERFVKLEQDVALPAFVEGYHMPADGTPDAYPLRLASKILSEGDSSRIYRRLIDERQIALQAESAGNFTEDPNLFFVFAVLNPGHSPAEGEKEMESVLDTLKTTPVPEGELNKAKNEIVREFVASRESDQSRGDELGYDSVVLKDPDLVNTELRRFLSVTPQQIEQVMRKYFVPANMTLVEVYPSAAPNSGRAAGPQSSNAAW